MEEHRHTEPIDVYAVVDQLLPPRTWQENPLLWIGLVVAVFMAVPFFASWATRVPTTAASTSAQAASAPAVEPAQPATVYPSPQHDTAAAAPAQPTPAQTAGPTDSSRQLITKCVERGRVVYTQTGQCAGSVSALPIDTSKNVVGPSAPSPGLSPVFGGERR